jgi:hypothetical protein
MLNGIKIPLKSGPTKNKGWRVLLWVFVLFCFLFPIRKGYKKQKQNKQITIRKYTQSLVPSTSTPSQEGLAAEGHPESPRMEAFSISANNGWGKNRATEQTLPTSPLNTIGCASQGFSTTMWVEEVP